MQTGTVKGFYDGLGTKEWRRLEKDAYHRLEWLTNIRFIERYLPKSGRVLDAGGGPGRYSIYLAKKGYRVVLLDMSPVQLNIARRQAEWARAPPASIEYVEGVLPDLSRFPDRCFDAVLCLIALSHLIDRRDRNKAVKELVRVTKPGAPLFVSVINRYAVFKTVLQRRSLWPNLLDPAHQELYEKGVHHAHPDRPIGHFTDAYFFTPGELRETFEKAGVRVLKMAACEGLASHLRKQVNELAGDNRMWRRWMEIHWQTCEDPSVIGVSEHLLLVGRKR